MTIFYIYVAIKTLSVKHDLMFTAIALDASVIWATISIYNIYTVLIRG